ncbi:unnamed protein product [Pedinophyceae sp. YPF-701]|nr:unnamed protein product [Pedinophyceae sp. YPF-701]
MGCASSAVREPDEASRPPEPVKGQEYHFHFESAGNAIVVKKGDGNVDGAPMTYPTWMQVETRGGGRPGEFRRFALKTFEKVPRAGDPAKLEHKTLVRAFAFGPLVQWRNWRDPCADELGTIPDFTSGGVSEINHKCKAIIHLKVLLKAPRPASPRAAATAYDFDNAPVGMIAPGPDETKAIDALETVGYLEVKCKAMFKRDDHWHKQPSSKKKHAAGVPYRIRFGPLCHQTVAYSCRLWLGGSPHVAGSGATEIPVSVSGGPDSSTTPGSRHDLHSSAFRAASHYHSSTNAPMATGVVTSADHDPAVAAMAGFVAARLLTPLLCGVPAPPFPRDRVNHVHGKMYYKGKVPASEKIGLSAMSAGVAAGGGAAGGVGDSSKANFPEEERETGQYEAQGDWPESALPAGTGGVAVV